MVVKPNQIRCDENIRNISNMKYIDAAKAEKVFEKVNQNINEIVAVNINFQAKMH